MFSYPVGISGLDGTDLLPALAVSPRSDESAVLAMYEALKAETKGKPWLVATGSLTNVALLFASFPDLVEHIRGLSIMGGAIGGGFTKAPMGHIKGEGERFGNVSAWAEFNIYVRCVPPSSLARLVKDDCMYD